MRDYLCKEDHLISTIEFHKKCIPEKMEKIASLQEDIKNGIQRYPRKNEDIIFDTKGDMFQYIYELIRAQYSLGLSCDELEKYYIQGVDALSDIGLQKIGYVNVIQYFSLGILLEISDDKLDRLVKLADEEALDDILFDFLVKAYGLNRSICSTGFQKGNPYSRMEEIIDTARKDPEGASRKLADYVTKKWLKGHSDYGWAKAHKWHSYYGLWSFEAAAVAKIFRLDDSKLKEDNHYPYDLAHYKKDKAFNTAIDLNKKELSGNASQDAQNEKSIPANPELEQMIPNEFREEINQLLVDFASLGDEDFWGKYNLRELWYLADEYKRDKAGKPLIGSLIINQLVSLDYILQLDWKEEIEDYAEHMKNYWEGSEVKLISFELNNDQNYYAKVPVSCNLESIYEVKIETVFLKEQAEDDTAAARELKEEGENAPPQGTRMRDPLCKEKDLTFIIKLYRESIAEEEKDIELCKEDEKNNIQRYPGSNGEIIFNMKTLIFKRLDEIVRAEYSLGTECSYIEECFSKMAEIMPDITYDYIGYLNLLEVISLAILLEAPKKDFQVLVDAADREKVNDILLDRLIHAYGGKRKMVSSEYEKEKPYKEAVEIIELAGSDKTKATAKLEEYVQKKWLKGHSDYGWTRAHKEGAYWGFWSFEAAAIAKIFQLDDSKLKEDNHYPYDMAHYKDG
ncbi:MAG: DUF1911 domain-containing protein [Lachnoclostridium sp.]|nr:DUF1911 domain-containing protein [Lachnospira sp.]MCM1247240.1 DUF1911 domain-containing protein [Lachnoclostridium sp.]